MAAILEAHGIFKQYAAADGPLTVLNNIDLRLDKGMFMVIMGASGSGKSSLLNILGCLDRPSAGSYWLDGVEVTGASDDQLSRLRSRCIGFVFQTFNLISHLTVTENVALPFLYRPLDRMEAERRVRAAIKQVGLKHRCDHRPGELSGGEMQRAAVARALAIDPAVILADEPTGNLDSQNSMAIMDLFQRLHRQGRSIVLVTHERDAAVSADTHITLHDGRILYDAK
ncbi:MAG: macrolide ABC transporter ATP-binding protein [Deltaproteobacteria bacterium]|nr:MAG: macrolide ABC transporter ATP-binding protein [Deltaproteobacteria bacterium]